MPNSLTHSLTALSDTFSQAQCRLAAATALLLWRKCIDFRGEKPFTKLIVYVYVMFSKYRFSFDPSLWWPMLLRMASIKSHAHRLPTSPNQNMRYAKHLKDFHTFCKMCHTYKNILLKCNMQELLENEVYFLFKQLIAK